ncbi:hypothetical protein TI39_contig4143g00007 [Zymoseptoria brevis]|uniref:Uncharacterized protein n=1 Tax=Zymoseptoria brevis TaxID=1047168 RepID=A0A0F4GFR2_9PEZI|nr:hypothetical protein TI39_contig4143g00007 [Zymoseptoria brevis]
MWDQENPLNSEDEYGMLQETPLNSEDEYDMLQETPLNSEVDDVMQRERDESEVDDTLATQRGEREADVFLPQDESEDDEILDTEEIEEEESDDNSDASFIDDKSTESQDSEFDEQDEDEDEENQQDAGKQQRNTRAAGKRRKRAITPTDDEDDDVEDDVDQQDAGNRRRNTRATKKNHKHSAIPMAERDQDDDEEVHDAGPVKRYGRQNRTHLNRHPDRDANFNSDEDTRWRLALSKQRGAREPQLRHNVDGATIAKYKSMEAWKTLTASTKRLFESGRFARKYLGSGGEQRFKGAALFPTDAGEGLVDWKEMSREARIIMQETKSMPILKWACKFVYYRLGWVQYMADQITFDVAKRFGYGGKRGDRPAIAKFFEGFKETLLELFLIAPAIYSTDTRLAKSAD